MRLFIAQDLSGFQVTEISYTQAPKRAQFLVIASLLYTGTCNLLFLCHSFHAILVIKTVGCIRQ